jgi:NhaP-type Na+/H+ and K+/H+ antiporter
MYDDLISGFGSSLRLCASAVILSLACLVGAVNAAEEKGKILYQNDFSKGEVGKLPDEMLLLDGGFAVQEINGNKVLQLPGAPLDTFGVLFGPTETANLAISARVHSTRKGRREPAFAVGLNGNAGYRLQVSAAKKLLEL